ncbi:hypothetical protein ABPG75_011250 [Micractinium tetrahymenae]
MAAAGPAAAAAGAGEKKKRKSSKKKERKTLTAKGKRAAVLAVLADVEVNGAAAATAAAAGAQAATPPREQQQQQQQQQQHHHQPQAAGATAAPAEDPAATANLGRAWSKADIGMLARLAEDRAFLLATIPQHPAEGELDWELISRHFGRYSRGGVAVRQQYYAVQRLVKAARHEGKKGRSYVDLVRQALERLPGRRGTVYEIQAVLKRDFSSSLDKYRDKGRLRWKAAVGEVLRDHGALFEQVGKTPTGKIVWQLSVTAAAGQQ